MFALNKKTKNKETVDEINMYVTGVGIGFIYAPYEIKSFADGEINLVIPFTALANYLLPEFK